VPAQAGMEGLEEPEKRLKERIWLKGQKINDFNTSHKPKNIFSDKLLILLSSKKTVFRYYSLTVLRFYG
jgi:hypothetical protein